IFLHQKHAPALNLLGTPLWTNPSLVSRNPMRSEGCFGVLRSVQANPLSALELLDFSDIHVNREFDDLTSSVKVILPGLYIKLPTKWSTKKNSCPSSDHLNDYVVWFPHLSHWPLQL
uniref:Leucine rich repeat containing 74B n=1 Tax=Phocoena sinus TaxID=42100 RepID=A0A8C9BWG3_PHOSS